LNPPLFFNHEKHEDHEKYPHAEARRRKPLPPLAGEEPVLAKAGIGMGVSGIRGQRSEVRHQSVG